MHQNCSLEKQVWCFASCFSQQKFTEINAQEHLGRALFLNRQVASLPSPAQMASAFTVSTLISAVTPVMEFTNSFMTIAAGEDVSTNGAELIFPPSGMGRWVTVV